MFVDVLFKNNERLETELPIGTLLHVKLYAELDGIEIYCSTFVLLVAKLAVIQLVELVVIVEYDWLAIDDIDCVVYEYVTANDAVSALLAVIGYIEPVTNWVPPLTAVRAQDAVPTKPTGVVVAVITPVTVKLPVTDVANSCAIIKLLKCGQNMLTY